MGFYGRQRDQAGADGHKCPISGLLRPTLLYRLLSLTKRYEAPWMQHAGPVAWASAADRLVMREGGQ